MDLNKETRYQDRKTLEQDEEVQEYERQRLARREQERQEKDWQNQERQEGERGEDTKPQGQERQETQTEPGTRGDKTTFHEQKGSWRKPDVPNEDYGLGRKFYYPSNGADEESNPNNMGIGFEYGGRGHPLDHQIINGNAVTITNRNEADLPSDRNEA